MYCSIKWSVLDPFTRHKFASCIFNGTVDISFYTLDAHITVCQEILPVASESIFCATLSSLGNLKSLFLSICYSIVDPKHRTYQLKVFNLESKFLSNRFEQYLLNVSLVCHPVVEVDSLSREVTSPTTPLVDVIEDILERELWSDENRRIYMDGTYFEYVWKCGNVWKCGKTPIPAKSPSSDFGCL